MKTQHFFLLALAKGFWIRAGQQVGGLAIAVSLVSNPVVVQAQAAQTVELDRNGAVKAIPFELTQTTVYSHTQFYGHPYPGVAYPPNVYIPHRYPSGAQYSNPNGIHNSVLINPTLINTPIYNSTLINSHHGRVRALPPHVVKYRYSSPNRITFPNIQSPHYYPQTRYPQIHYPQPVHRSPHYYPQTRYPKIQYPQPIRRW